MPPASRSTSSASATRRCRRSGREASGGCSAGTGTSTAAPQCATGSNLSSSTCSASPSARRVQTADAIYDQILACLGEDAFRPRALYARFGDRGARDDRRSVRRPRPAPGTGRGPDLGGEGDPDVPARPVSRARPTGLARGDRRARRGSGHRHGRLRRAISGRSSSGGSSSSSTAQPPPTTATSTRAPIRSTSPTPSASTGPRSQARRPRPRRSRSGGTWCSRWRGCRATTGS